MKKLAAIALALGLALTGCEEPKSKEWHKAYEECISYYTEDLGTPEHLYYPDITTPAQLEKACAKTADRQAK